VFFFFLSCFAAVAGYLLQKKSTDLTVQAYRTTLEDLQKFSNQARAWRSRIKSEEERGKKKRQKRQKRRRKGNKAGKPHQ
jgi:hypothetical protein